MSRRAWLGGLGASAAALVMGTLGLLVEAPENLGLIQDVAYVGVPAGIVVLYAAARETRPWTVLAAGLLVDLEAVLLAFGPLMALPFVVALPLVGLAAWARVLPLQRLLPAYLLGWMASGLGVTIAVLREAHLVEAWALLIIPCFWAIDALAMALLWRLDAGRMAALEAVTRAEARSRELLDHVELFGVDVTADGRIEFINEYALRLTGWTRDEVLGRDWHATFATPERRHKGRENMEMVRAGRGTMASQRESLILTKSGERRLMRWSHVTRRDAKGQLAGVASLGEDITAAREAEEELRRSAELLSKVMVGSPLATVVVGLDRNVQLWNPAIARLLGWSEEEVVGRRVPMISQGKDRWSVVKVYLRALRGEPLDHQLLELRRRDGTVVKARMYGGALRDRDGKAIAVAIQAVDETAEDALLQRLIEAEKMEAVGRLAGGVAHDFNNSLTAIGGFASLIATTSSDPEAREAAETILTASKRAANLTRELLAYSRHSLLQPQTIDANALVGSVRPMLTPLLGEDISVVIESRASAAMVRVDPGGLERVIVNLAANARDAMPAGGRLAICTDRVDGAAPDGTKGRWVRISVADTGSGIPEQVQSQVFDPFFTTKPVGSGTGLGLAMVKGFVTQSGGQVTLASGPDGTTIEILLPESAEAEAALPEPEGVEAWGRGETILVVEDEPMVAVMAFGVLGRRGYRVLLADSGVSAVALIRGHRGPIALLLVDVILPDMRGPALAAVAREVHPEAAVLFASGYSTEAIGRAGELPPDVDLVEKPYSAEELLERVRAAIDRAAGDPASGGDGVAAGPRRSGGTAAGPTDPA